MLALWLPASALIVVVCAISLVYISYRLGRQERWFAASLVVGATALLLRGYGAFDFALHPWDERFHALVAKHLIEQPLVPTLYNDPVLPVRLSRLVQQSHLAS